MVYDTGNTWKHVNNFERYLDKGGNANQNVKYQLDEDFTDEDLGKVISHWQSNQLPRLEMLHDYYYSHNGGILRRESRTRGSDYRKSSPFARQISDFLTSYSVSNAVAPIFKENDAHEQFDKFNRINDIDSLNYDIWLDTSVFGRGYELVYRNRDKETHSVRIDPREAFVIYNLDIEPTPIAFVRVVSNPLHDDGKRDITVYKTDGTYSYHAVPANGNLGRYTDFVPNAFDDVPVIEYMNNNERVGDFEPVIGLIDLYDFANNDTANWLSDLPDSTLVLSGDIDSMLGTGNEYDEDGFEDTEIGKHKVLKELKDSNLLTLRTGIGANGQEIPTKAEYLHPEYDVNGQESYKKRLEDDIFRGSYVPNLAQLSVGGSISGIAMKYKLLGTIEISERKRRFFEKGLRQRYNIVAEVDTAIKPLLPELVFRFTDNLPTDNATIAKQLHDAGLKLPQEYLAGLLPDVDDVDAFMDSVQREENAITDQYQQGLGFNQE